MSILNKYKRIKHFLAVVKDKYYDFVLSQDHGNAINFDPDGNLTEDGLAGYIDFTLDECVLDYGFVSLNNYKWSEAFNNGIELKDIGFTGIDNGLFWFDKDTITDEEFLGLLTGSTVTYNVNDTRMFVFPVSGNTKQYGYDYEYHPNEFISLKGGFLQGVYKMEGFDYHILPQYIDNALQMEMVLRPVSYEMSGATLNDTYPENKGIFFYLGSRAENKFAVLNGADISEYEYRYIPEETEYFPFLSDTTITDSEGNDVSKMPKSQLKTDNKFLLFDQTPSGFTVDTWAEYADSEFVLESEQTNSTDNLFLLMNHTPSGYTTETIDRLRIPVSGKTYENYKIKKDFIDNCFALKLNDDYSIGYRYLVKDCDSETGWSIREEKTFPNIVSENEWSTINVRFQILSGNLDACGKSNGNRKMKTYIYVNGYLKLVSQELPEFNFKALNESPTKQEMVPFSISIGGGTQGLAEMVWTDYQKIPEKILPIEKNFAGSFIGDIASFKIYSRPLEYNEVKNNWVYEKKRTKIIQYN